MNDSHLAEDAAQETFLRAWKALPSFNHDVDLTHWLRRIARNHCHDLWRSLERGRFMAVSSEPLVDHEDPGAEQAVAAIADRISVRGLLRRLRPRDAQLLIDHHAVGVSVQSLARQWHMTKGAMEVALHRARQRARHSSRQEDLRGLIPLLALRRGWLWAQRCLPGLRDAGAPAAGAFAHLAVAALAMGVAQPAAPSALEQAPTPSRQQTVDVSAPQSIRAPARANPADSATAKKSRGARAGERAGRTRAAALGTKADSEHSESLLAFDPVQVADREVRSSPDDSWELERRYAVRDPVTGRELAARETHKGRLSELQPVDRRTCPAAKAGGPVVTCDEAADE